MTATYHIIGGGVAGLACAWFLKQRNEDIKIVVYEASSKLGGRAYSYYDKSLDTSLDNGVHAVVGANNFLAQFIKKREWRQGINFISPDNTEISNSLFKNRRVLLKGICNTDSSKIAFSIKKKILRELFPFSSEKLKLWFSQQNLSQRIINLLAAYADEVYLNTKLTKIKTQFGRAAQLKFDKKVIDIGAQDRVIIALDNVNCNKILNVPVLEHNQIVNIIYRVSQTIFLPRRSKFIGVKDGIGDWLFVSGNLLSVVISDYQADKEDLSELALKVWAEIDKIRGVNSAFMPPYKVVCYKNATIRQDKANNKRRPKSAATEYPNVFIAGDWTMKDYPCCMETAVKSAKRAVRAALKSV